MKRRILYRLCRAVALVAFLGGAGGCGIYTSFETPRYAETADAFGGVAADTVSTGDIHWRDFFTDEKLRALIETALGNNADMQSALLNVEMAQASLRASKLAFYPSLDFSPSAAYTNGSWEVQLPVSASWEIDLFGKLRNAKKRQQAALLQTEAYVQAVRSQLIGAVAAAYHTLLNLDAQRAIYERTEESWKRNVEVTRRLMNAGRYNSASVSQAEAGYYDVLNNLIDIEREIRATENILCALLGQTPRGIERGNADEWRSPDVIAAGVPLSVLSGRPDVRQAEMELAQAFYAANEARASFYPLLTVSGAYDFRSTLYSAVASVVQPLFRRGTLKANLRVAEAAREQSAVRFRQAIIEAGIEVNDAFAAVGSARAKRENYAAQIGHLENAVASTRLLMTYGTATYLEVLTAQQTLLAAQIGESVNRLSEISGVITLYRALGGGRNP